MLSLPEDILVTLVESWLKWQGLVKLDSAVCEHSHRPRFVQVISKCPLNERLVIFAAGVDEYVRWRALRQNSALSALIATGAVSDSFVRNEESSSAALASVELLVASGSSVQGNTVRWLEKITPFYRNLKKIQGSHLKAEGGDWFCALGQNVQCLLDLDVFFDEFDSTQPPLLQHFQACENLLMVRWLNRDCMGIELVVPKNFNLTHVDINRCESLTEETFAQILSLPHLQHTNLGSSPTIKGTGALNIISTSTQFLSFHLTFFDAMTNSDLLRVLSAIPNKGNVRVIIKYMKLITAQIDRECQELAIKALEVHLLSSEF
jgi:hypothetical protein